MILVLMLQIHSFCYWYWYCNLGSSNIEIEIEIHIPLSHSPDFSTVRISFKLLLKKPNFPSLSAKKLFAQNWPTKKLVLKIRNWWFEMRSAISMVKTRYSHNHKRKGNYLLLEYTYFFIKCHYSSWNHVWNRVQIWSNSYC